MGWDLTEQVAPVCKTVTDFATKVIGSGGRVYKVRYGKWVTPHYLYDWHCECDGYKFRQDCSHITAAKKLRCGWNRHHEAYSMPEDRKCPDCGGELDFIKVGV